MNFKELLESIIEEATILKEEAKEILKNAKVEVEQIILGED